MRRPVRRVGRHGSMRRSPHPMIGRALLSSLSAIAILFASLGVGLASASPQSSTTRGGTSSTTRTGVARLGPAATGVTHATGPSNGVVDLSQVDTYYPYSMRVLSGRQVAGSYPTTTTTSGWTRPGESDLGPTRRRQHFNQSPLVPTGSTLITAPGPTMQTSMCGQPFEAVATRGLSAAR